MSEKSKTFKENRLRELMETQGLDVKNLAFRTGMNQSMVYKYLNGTAPLPDALVVIAQALNTTTDYLLGLSDDPQGYRLIYTDKSEEEAIELLRGVSPDERRRILAAIRALVQH